MRVLPKKRPLKIVSLTLMFVGGSKIIGAFDPWSKEANVWSVAAGSVYLLATVVPTASPTPINRTPAEPVSL